MKHILIYFLLLMSMSSCCKKNNLTIDYGELNPNDFKMYFSGYDGGYDGKSGYNHKPIYEVKDIPFVYGENNWVIIYKGKKQCKFRHFKTNWRHSHSYKFAFHERQDTLYCNIDIRGKNSLKHAVYFTIASKENEK